MPKITTGLLWCMVVAGVLARSAAVAADDANKATVHRFKLTVDSHNETKLPMETQKLAANTEFDYAWESTGRERILSFDHIKTDMNFNDKPAMKSLFSHARYTLTNAEGKTEDFQFDAAPKKLQEILANSFETPVDKIEVDDNGKVVKETNLGRQPSMINQDMMVNAKLFHPPFMSGKSQWDADAEAVAGKAQTVKGKLTYKKVRTEKDNVVVKVTGTLSNNKIEISQVPPIYMQDVKYDVSGEETYNTAQKEWVSGKLTLGTTWKLVSNGETAGTSEGTLVLTFESMP